MAIKTRSRTWFVLFTLLACMVLAGLGTWQMQRLAWKTELLHRIGTRMAEPAAPLPETLDDAKAWEYRRVTLAGNFLYDHEFLVKPRTLDGASGYHVLVPFSRISGGIVFINRGWISDALMGKAVRPTGIVQVEGIVQAPEKSRFTPDNVPAKNDWYWADVAAMAQAARVAAPLPVIVTVSTQAPGVYPAGGQVRLDIPNNHRQYALFWYGMALALLAVCAVYCLQKEKEEKTHAILQDT